MAIQKAFRWLTPTDADINRPDGDEESNFEAAVTESPGKCGIVVQFQRHDPLMPAKKLVWRSEIDIDFHWFAEKALAASIIGRLKQDGVLAPSCPTPTLPPGI